MPLKIEANGVIFRNPWPGHRVINAFYPMILPLPGGELLCVLRIGGALYSPDGMLNVFRSNDSGETWQRQGPIRDRTQDAYNYSDSHLTLLHDGSIVLRTGRWDLSDPDRFVINEKTQGLAPMETCFLRSTDGGHTWSEPVVAEIRTQFEEGVEPASIGGVVELADGSWFQLFDSWKSYDNAGSFNLNSYGLISRDGGRTWQNKGPVAVGSSYNRSFSHGIAAPMKDGRVFVSYWTAEPQLQRSLELHTVTSADAAARRWSAPKTTGIPGQSNCAVDMGSGRTLIIYSHRENTEQPGIKVVLSEDERETWQLDQPLVVWDAYGKESLGVARSSIYPSSHDSVAYGAPRIIDLDQRHALATFWCSQGADTHCRWCRIRID